PFVRADSIRVSYDITRLLGGSIVLDDVVLYSPDVVLEKLPGQSLWNYEAIFEQADVGPDERRLILFTNARIIDGAFTIRYPLDEPISPSDTARMIVERHAQGVTRVLRFEDINA